MLLEDKILKIDEPKLEDTIGLLPTDSADTMEEFFEKFIRPRFPARDVIKQWHRVLMDYTNDLSTLSCCVRFGNTGSKKLSDWGESGYYKLRRGWLTKNKNDDFEYFFADNAFPAFVCKMAIDGFAPANAKELRAVFRKHKFPYGFGFMVDNKVNEYKGVVIDIANEPGFLDNYKISHVFDAGEQFLMDDGSVQGDVELSPKYYPIGHSNDFLNQHDRIRKMDISDEAKKVIVAKFLRFAHPINYFLTPSKKGHTCSAKVYKNDIGEDPVMIYLVKEYLKKEFPVEYKEFLEKIMWKDGYIGIKYARPAKTKKTSSKPKSTKTPSKTPAKATGAARSRNYDKYVFNGKTYPKNQLVLAVVQEHVKKNGITTFTELNNAFPDSLNKTYGVVKQAKNIRDSYKGVGGQQPCYYVKPTQVITLSGEEIMVCNQWTLDLIKEFIDHVKKYGYVINKA